MEIKLVNNTGSDQMENLKNHIVLINPWIHQSTKLSREEFLEKVKSVEYLRTQINSNYVSFYITSQLEYQNLLKFHKLINEGVFDFQNHHVFAISIQPKLYDWFKSNSINTIEKQIVSWLAAHHFFCEEKREIHKDDIYKPLFSEMLDVIKKYYEGFNCVNFENNSIYKKKCKEKYISVCKEFYDCEPPDFLSSPFEYKILKEWGVNEKLNFDFIEGFFKNDDWKRIIGNHSEDNLFSGISNDILWFKWKHVFSTFEQRENFVYSYYIETPSDNKKTLKIKREVIPQNVKNEVWKRDEGLCVQCGKNEKLEFDHIIPIVKGGSNTYRNLQLLCETCNREKHSKI